jgi:hypothetical protein
MLTLIVRSKGAVSPKMTRVDSQHNTQPVIDVNWRCCLTFARQTKYTFLRWYDRPLAVRHTPRTTSADRSRSITVHWRRPIGNPRVNMGGVMFAPGNGNESLYRLHSNNIPYEPPSSWRAFQSVKAFPDCGMLYYRIMQSSLQAACRSCTRAATQFQIFLLRRLQAAPWWNSDWTAMHKHVGPVACDAAQLFKWSNDFRIYL